MLVQPQEGRDTKRGVACIVEGQGRERGETGPVGKEEEERGKGDKGKQAVCKLENGVV